jgi:predicted  nucleic acid-binding Zn-ribbon protein
MSASDKNDRPELKAFRELESLVRNLGEELAAFRRRALAAEAQLKDGGQTPARAKSGGASSELQAENEALRTRLARAEERVKQMVDRVRFLRQQVQTQTGAGAR